MHKFETFLLFLVASLLCGCTFIETKVEMTKGRFKIPEIENFNGVGKFVPEQTLLKGFSFSVAKAKDREIPMKVSNKEKVFSDSIILPNSKVDFAYEHKAWDFAGTADFLFKDEIVLSGLSFGFNSSLSAFIRGVVGINLTHFESGLFGYFALGKWQSSYTGCRYTESFYDMGKRIPASKKTYEENYSGKIVTTAAAGTYASVYAGPAALSGSISMFSPWGGTEDRMDLTFEFPYLFKAYLGTSLWIGDHIKISAGITDYLNAEKRNLSFGGSAGLWL